MWTLLCAALVVVLPARPAVATSSACLAAGTWSAGCTLSGALTLTGDVTIPSGASVTIPSGASVTIPSNFKLTISGPKGSLPPAALLNSGTLTNSGHIAGTGILWNANQDGTVSGTLDNKGTIDPQVYGLGVKVSLADVRNDSPSPSQSIPTCGATIPKEASIWVNTVTTGENTTWNLTSDTWGQPSSVTVSSSGGEQSVFLTLFKGQAFKLRNGTQVGGGGSYYLETAPGWNYYDFTITESNLKNEYYGNLELQLLNSESEYRNSSIFLYVTWLPAPFGTVGDLNLTHCTGTWAASQPTSNPKQSDALDWSHLEITQGKAGFGVALKRYTAAAGAQRGLSGTISEIDATSFQAPFFGPLIYDPIVVKTDPQQGPRLVQGNYLTYRKVDLYVTNNITAQATDSADPPYEFTKEHIQTLADYKVDTTAGDSKHPLWTDLVRVESGKNLLLEYVLDTDSNVQICYPQNSPCKGAPIEVVSPEACSSPTATNQCSMTGPLTEGCCWPDPSKLPTNMQPLVYKDADGHDHLFIFDYDNSTSGPDRSYSFRIKTSGGDIDPTIVEKAPPPVGG